MATKARTSLTSLERLERQVQAISGDRAQGDAWEKALKSWINAGGHPELTKAWMWGEWPGKLKAGLKGDKGVDLVAETRDKQLAPYVKLGYKHLTGFSTPHDEESLVRFAEEVKPQLEKI